MVVIDFILNLAALLIWLNWRALGIDPLLQSPPTSIVGALRRAEPLRWKRWHLALGLLALLIGRAWFYYQVGPSMDWTPNLRLGAIAISFRSEFFDRMVLFSFLSFAVTLTVFYSWLLLFSLLGTQNSDGDPLQRLIRLHLGRVDRWPWGLKLLLPLILVCLTWLIVQPILIWLNIVPNAASILHRFEQAFIIGLGTYLAWKIVLAVVLGLFLVSSYIYLGNHWFWNFVGMNGRRLLTPLRWRPLNAVLRFGKVDLAPLLAILLVFFVFEYAERGLTQLYERLAL